VAIGLLRRARNSLLKDKSYRRIINHPNYNPRLIEFVTGLASQRLTDAENSNYVEFAVGILDNPDLIWERAFEWQLDDTCKDVLISLASMPTGTAYEDLQIASQAVAHAGRRARSSSRSISAGDADTRRLLYA
jgi:hypothetical protein